MKSILKGKGEGMRNRADENTFLQLEPIFLLLDDPVKIEMVRDYLVGGVTAEEIMRKYEVTKPVLYRSVAKFESAKIAFMAAAMRKEMLLLDELTHSFNETAESGN